MSVPFHQTAHAAELWGGEHWTVPLGDSFVGVQATPTRALPGHWILRVPRFGRGLGRERAAEGLESLRHLALDKPVLRLHVEVWAEDESERRSLSWACEAAGFREVPMNSYRRTLLMALSPPVEEIFSGLHKTGRQNVRAPSKKGLEVRPVTEAFLADRLSAILRESCERTGMIYDPDDTDAMIRLSNENPSLFHLVGTFRPDREGPESLVAAASAVNHGEIVEYSAAGSLRLSDMNVPLLYAPTWDLIAWAKAQGAKWWDFGGITDATQADGTAPTGGINDFKRYFSRNVVEVGREYQFVPSRGKEWIARLATSLATRIRGGTA